MKSPRSLEDREELDDFLTELDQQISALKAGLRALTGEAPGKLENAVEQMRIAAHTIKGSAGTFGFSPLATMGRILEQLLLQVKEGRLSSQSPPVQEFIQAGIQSLASRWVAKRVEGRLGENGDEGALGRRCIVDAEAMSKAPGKPRVPGAGSR